MIGLIGACGCSSADAGRGPAARAAGPVVITVWTGQDPGPEKILEGLAAKFHALHPDVTIRMSRGAPTTDELLPRLTAAFGAGTYPDISYAYGSWASALRQSDKTLDLTREVADSRVRWEEFPEAARQTASPGSRVIGFPAVVDNIGLLWNKKLFAAAGIPFPTNDWTWEDFRSAAKKLTDPVHHVFGTAYPVSGSEDTTWHLWPLFWQNGGSVLSGDEKRAVFDSDAGISALTFLRSMAVKDRSVYLSPDDEKYIELFTSGRIGMVMSGPWELADVLRAGLDYGVSYLPSFGDGNHQTISAPDLWALFDHQDENRSHWAFEFTAWLTSSAVDPEFNLAAGNLPLRSSEASSPEFAEFIRKYPGARTFFDNLQNAKVGRPTVPGYKGLSQALGNAIALTLRGGADPAQALQEAVRLSNIALAKGDS
ncbi:ABC transporter substrate-binding protein [Streptomyces sp. RKAG293]|uniref:ABC transporter substrate-binding protein n=1 Tax=Streptomyces sp. RKAG293 TaxID=2893403 RepID=UPI0020345969|nr:ABC transporter substrate-binding protein [Streptomyces sp. RKAG293]MCM2422790.1 ABC transporter substrate-binding protein [Streptomyces sp. RKAG293]